GKRHGLARLDVPIESSRYNERSRRQLPCFAQCFATLVRVLDYVYDVTQVHDVRGGFLGAGCVNWIPTGGGHSHVAQRGDVRSPAAAEVEEASIRPDEPVV